MTDDLHQSLVNEHERVDTFTRESIQLIQSPAYFTMSIDAILLADFIKLPTRKKFNYLDFCSGNGVIPLLLSHRTQQKLYGLEIQPALVDMARRSAKLNQVEDQVTFIQQDLNDYTRPQGTIFDVVSCNPPYFLVEDSDQTHKITSHAIARHELYLTMDQWIKKASQVLKDHGKLFFVHRPDRLDDIFEHLLNHNFSVNRMKFVYPKENANANAVLIEAIYRGGRHGVKVEPSITVHNENNDYTAEMMAIYYG